MATIKLTDRQILHTRLCNAVLPVYGSLRLISARSVYAKTVAYLILNTLASYYYYSLRGWEVKTSNLNFYS